MKPIKLSIVLFTSKVYTDGSSPIYIRLSQLGKTEYIPTGHNVKPENFDSREKLGKCFTSKKFNEVYSKYERDQMRPDDAKAKKAALAGVVVHPSAHRINNDIFDLKDKIERLISLKSNEGKFITIHEIKHDIARDYKPNSFLTFAKDYHKSLVAQDRVGTSLRYGSTISKIEYYLKGKDLLFLEITDEWLIKYRQHLLSENPKYLKHGIPSGHKPNSTNTIFTDFKTIRELYYLAAKDGIFEMHRNAFKGKFSMRWEEPNQTKLEEREVLAICEARFTEGSRMELARQLFVFCFFHSGIRIRDAITLKWDMIKGDFIEYDQQKKNRKLKVMIRPEAKYILNYYKKITFGKSEYIFPLVKQEVKGGLDEYRDRTSKTSLINKELRNIAETLGIKKKLHTHVARHSFAQIAVDNDMTISEISAALDHSSRKQTMTYIGKANLEKLNKSLDRVFQFKKAKQNVNENRKKKVK